MRSLKYYLPGTLLILTAALIIALPEILVAFVSACIIVAGIISLYVGHKMRKLEKEAAGFNDAFFSDNYFRTPFYRVWHNRFW